MRMAGSRTTTGCRGQHGDDILRRDATEAVGVVPGHDVGQRWPTDQVDGGGLHQSGLRIGQAVAQQIDPGLDAGSAKLGDAAHLLALRRVIRLRVEAKVREEAIDLALADVERLLVAGIDVDVDVRLQDIGGLVRDLQASRWHALVVRVSRHLSESPSDVSGSRWALTCRDDAAPVSDARRKSCDAKPGVGRLAEGLRCRPSPISASHGGRSGPVIRR